MHCSREEEEEKKKRENVRGNNNTFACLWTHTDYVTTPTCSVQAQDTLPNLVIDQKKSPE